MWQQGSCECLDGYDLLGRRAACFSVVVIGRDIYEGDFEFVSFGINLHVEMGGSVKVAVLSNQYRCTCEDVLRQRKPHLHIGLTLKPLIVRLRRSQWSNRFVSSPNHCAPISAYRLPHASIQRERFRPCLRPVSLTSAQRKVGLKWPSIVPLERLVWRNWLH